ncbi:MAG: PTS lactose/cellobiose transporter subunit IIA [Candidatus Asgardarchaeia archaeon]
MTSNLEEINQIAFRIIATAGEARSKVFKAIELIYDEDFNEAEKCLREAEELIAEANEAQTELLKREARGERNIPTILFVHAYDILMAAITEKDLTGSLMKVFKKIVGGKEK